MTCYLHVSQKAARGTPRSLIYLSTGKKLKKAAVAWSPKDFGLDSVASPEGSSIAGWLRVLDSDSLPLNLGSPVPF